MRPLIVITLLTAILSACGDGHGRADPPPSGERRSQAPSTGPAGPVGESREFRDWLAVCDNVNACFAFGPASRGTGWVRVEAPAGPSPTRTVAVGYWPEAGAPNDGPITLRIDGRDFVAPAVGGGEARLIPAGQVADAVARLVMAREIDLRVGGEGATLSPSGAAAALLWIDERQGRLGTPGALVRRGDRPESEVPAPPAAPRVVAAPTVSQAGFGDENQVLPAALEALPAVKACRAETAGVEGASRSVMSARLDASTELWAVPCFAGAYNIGHDWYITGPGGRDPRPARLASAGGETGARTINGGYSPETRTITAFAKGRGIGDCGTASTWTWTGRAFVLSAESRMEECWGVPADFWPTTWRTR